MSFLFSDIISVRCEAPAASGLQCLSCVIVIDTLTVSVTGQFGQFVKLFLKISVLIQYYCRENQTRQKMKGN